MKMLDLFSGCGGFSLGAHQAGFDVRLAVDIDPILTSSFRANFPDTRLLLQDVSKLKGREIIKQIGHVDGIFGGPPCQAFSDIGHRRKDDPRRELLVDFFRLVSEIRPAFFIAENVRGLQYEGSKETLTRGLDYVRRNYAIVGPVLLNAADFGGATQRERLFVIGMDLSRCNPLAIEDIERAMGTPASVHEAIGDLETASFHAEVDGFDVWRIRKRGRPTSYTKQMRSETGLFTGHRTTHHTAAVVRRFSRVKPGEVDRVGRHPRLSWGGLCPTLRAGTGNDRGSYQAVRPIHPRIYRVITVREAARLQGFPDWFRFHPTVWHSFRMIGNSVSPIIARALFQVISSRVERRGTFAMAAE